MQNTAKIISFTLAHQNENQKKDANTKIVQYGEPVKYFRREEIQALRRIVREQGEVALLRGNVIGVREWLAIDILTGTRVRDAKVANLRIADLVVKNGLLCDN